MMPPEILFLPKSCPFVSGSRGVWVSGFCPRASSGQLCSVFLCCLCSSGKLDPGKDFRSVASCAAQCLVRQWIQVLASSVLHFLFHALRTFRRVGPRWPTTQLADRSEPERLLYRLSLFCDVCSCRDAIEGLDTSAYTLWGYPCTQCQAYDSQNEFSVHKSFNPAFSSL